MCQTWPWSFWWSYFRMRLLCSCLFFCRPFSFLRQLNEADLCSSLLFHFNFSCCLTRVDSRKSKNIFKFWKFCFRSGEHWDNKRTKSKMRSEFDCTVKLERSWQSRFPFLPLHNYFLLPTTALNMFDPHASAGRYAKAPQACFTERLVPVLSFKMSLDRYRYSVPTCLSSRFVTKTSNASIGDCICSLQKETEFLRV